jgi:holo-[acyl-carrier protein] synthase
MITGIGVDILHLSRLRHLINRRGAERLAQRILSAREMAEFRSLPSSTGKDEVEEQTRYLANRWVMCQTNR